MFIFFGSQLTLRCHKEHHEGQVIDHVEPEFVVFLVVHRELCDLAPHISVGIPNVCRSIFGLQVKLDRVGLI